MICSMPPSALDYVVPTLGDAVPYHCVTLGAHGACVRLVTAGPRAHFGMSRFVVAELRAVPVNVNQTAVAVFVEFHMYGQGVTPIS